ncbi:MAG: NIPSNAP family protein [Parasphingorhabdus sp.]|nr:NIPSNAP family protein [Parasphingorhabdus sp.]
MTYFIRTNVRLKMGGAVGYSEMMGKLVPYMAKQGWELTLGLQPFVGDLTEMIHVWKVENFADIETALNACYSDPEAQEILAVMPDYLQNETFQIMVKTDYSG